MGFAETFERAARIAEQGWGQSERRHDDLVSQQSKLLQDADSAAVFLDEGEVPALYSIIRNPGLADALRLIQREGREAFYSGDIADALIAKIQSEGGVMTHEDLLPSSRSGLSLFRPTITVTTFFSCLHPGRVGRHWRC